MDTTTKLHNNGNFDNFVRMIRATDPTAIIGCSSVQYLTVDGVEPMVDSDGINDEDETNYRIVLFEPNHFEEDFTNGHVTPIGYGAPPNSWAYEEFTLPNMINAPTAKYEWKIVQKHGWFPIRKHWHSPQDDMSFDTEQAYRFVKSITDAKASMTFANTIDPGIFNMPGHIMRDEMVIMKAINDRLMLGNQAPEYEPYSRPNGAHLVGEEPHYEIETFTPDPTKVYTIDNKNGYRLYATGNSDTAESVSNTTTGKQVQWQFVQNGDKWHIQLYDPNNEFTKPRIRTINDGSTMANMTSTLAVGGWTQYTIEPSSASPGHFFLTIPGSPSSNNRLQLNGNGSVTYAASDATNGTVSFKFTEITPVISTVAPIPVNPVENSGPWDALALRKPPGYRETDIASVSGITSLFYKGLPYLGNETEVFAYYAAPSGTPPQGGWPAVVLVHGGGASADADYVSEWNSRGYAAISMDLEGHLPTTREEFNTSGPQRNGVFNDFQTDIEDQWYYHAVAQVILANSLIANFDEVNANKIGVTGISWGGTITSTVVGIDNRFKFAVPIYGNAFLAGSDGHQGKTLNSNATKESYVANTLQGSSYLHQAEMPILWLNGTNDFHFSVPSIVTSTETAKDAHAIITLGFSHGHTVGWSRPEVYEFANHALNGGTSDDFNLGKLSINDSHTQISISINSNHLANATSASIFYTADKSTDICWPDKVWVGQEVGLGNTITQTVPADVVGCFLTIYRNDGVELTSEIIFPKGREGCIPLHDSTTEYTNIPAKIEAENYSDATEGKTETKASTNDGSMVTLVGWIDSGESLFYNINNPLAGEYIFDFRIASKSAGSNFDILKDGVVIGAVNAPATEGWYTWDNATATVPLSKGNQTIEIKATSGGWNFDSLNISLNTEVITATPFTPDPTKVYTIDNKNGYRLYATGDSEIAESVSNTTTGKQVQWQFVQNGDKWHIQLYDPNNEFTKPRIRTINDGSTMANMTSKLAVGGWTQYTIEPNPASSGYYLLTIPGSPNTNNRLQLNGNGSVTYAASDATNGTVSFKFTEVSTITTELYVDYNATTNGNGSQASPFNTIPNAIEAIEANYPGKVKLHILGNIPETVAFTVAGGRENPIVFATTDINISLSKESPIGGVPTTTIQNLTPFSTSAQTAGNYTLSSSGMLTIYVNMDKTGGIQNGLTAETAYRFLTDAVDEANLEENWDKYILIVVTGTLFSETLETNLLDFDSNRTGGVTITGGANNNDNSNATIQGIPLTIKQGFDVINIKNMNFTGANARGSALYLESSMYPKFRVNGCNFTNLYRENDAGDTKMNAIIFTRAFESAHILIKDIKNNAFENISLGSGNLIKYTDDNGNISEYIPELLTDGYDDNGNTAANITGSKEIYVNFNKVSSNGDGLTQATAYNNLEDCLDAINEPSNWFREIEVLVKGTATENQTLVLSTFRTGGVTIQSVDNTNPCVFDNAQLSITHGEKERITISHISFKNQNGGGNNGSSAIYATIPELNGETGEPYIWIDNCTFSAMCFSDSCIEEDGLDRAVYPIMLDYNTSISINTKVNIFSNSFSNIHLGNGQLVSATSNNVKELLPEALFQGFDSKGNTVTLVTQFVNIDAPPSIIVFEHDPYTQYSIKPLTSPNIILDHNIKLKNIHQFLIDDGYKVSSGYSNYTIDSTDETADSHYFLAPTSYHTDGFPINHISNNYTDNYYNSDNQVELLKENVATLETTDYSQDPAVTNEVDLSLYKLHHSSQLTYDMEKNGSAHYLPVGTDIELTVDKGQFGAVIEIVDYVAPELAIACAAAPIACAAVALATITVIAAYYGYDPNVMPQIIRDADFPVFTWPPYNDPNFYYDAEELITFDIINYGILYIAHYELELWTQRLNDQGFNIEPIARAWHPEYMAGPDAQDNAFTAGVMYGQYFHEHIDAAYKITPINGQDGSFNVRLKANEKFGVASKTITETETVTETENEEFFQPVAGQAYTIKNSEGEYVAADGIADTLYASEELPDENSYEINNFLWYFAQMNSKFPNHWMLMRAEGGDKPVLKYEITTGKTEMISLGDAGETSFTNITLELPLSTSSTDTSNKNYYIRALDNLQYLDLDSSDTDVKFSLANNADSFDIQPLCLSQSSTGNRTLTDEEKTCGDEIAYYLFEMKDIKGTEGSEEVIFTDKANTRRRDEGVLLRGTDYTVAQDHIDKLKLDMEESFEYISQSRWLNWIKVGVKKSDWTNSAYRNSNIVLNYYEVFPPSDKLESSADTRIDIESYFEGSTSTVTNSNQHFATLEADAVKEEMNEDTYIQEAVIAVIDDGFNNVNRLNMFKHLFDQNLDNGEIIKTYDMGCKEEDANESDISGSGPSASSFNVNDHGTKVLTVLAGKDRIQNTYNNTETEYYGMAHKAKYILVRFEIDIPAETDGSYSDARKYAYGSLYGITRAFEAADYEGAQIISMSLAINPPEIVSAIGVDKKLKAMSSIATSKGMILAVSTGNNGMNDGYGINPAAWAQDVIGVAAVDSNKQVASFSSWGNSEGDPRVAAFGVNVPVINRLGEVKLKKGTSFAAPAIAGYTAFLMKDLRERENYHVNIIEIIGELIALCPNGEIDAKVGYGVPNHTEYIETYGGKTIRQTLAEDSDMLSLYPNPTHEDVFVMLPTTVSDNTNVYLKLSSISGAEIASKTMVKNGNVMYWDFSAEKPPRGVYLLTVFSGVFYETAKVIIK